jgi:lysophospholipase L1-like esterase
MLAAACSKSSPTSPTPPAPDPLKLTCPAPVSQNSQAGQPTPVPYTVATAEGGTRPVQVTCDPASNSTFPLGTTTVTCNAVDARSVTASCTFTITVVGPPRVSATNFLAFGDSITAGQITVFGEGGIHVQTVQDGLSYPTDLRQSLVSRYSAQTIIVDNAGSLGETTDAGLIRLPIVLTNRYQALLLMEGANDLGNQTSGAVRDHTLTNMQAMVRLAKARGVKVFLATLPPEDPLACCPRRGTGYVLLPSYNDGLRGLAVAENIVGVDVFAAFNGDLSQLGPDGLHPTAVGYQTVANAFFASIKSTLEAPSATPTFFFRRR